MSNRDPQIDEWLTEISEQAIHLEPRISEYQFKREVLGLLSDIFTSPISYKRYIQYVGELTKPLNVISDQDASSIVVTIPPIILPPRPTMASGVNGVTADSLFYHISRDRELGNQNTHDTVADFMSSITGFGDYVEEVINPIRAILKNYGVEMHPIPGLDFQPGQPVNQPVNDPSAMTSSYTDEYED